MRTCSFCGGDLDSTAGCSCPRGGVSIPIPPVLPPWPAPSASATALHDEIVELRQRVWDLEGRALAAEARATKAERERDEAREERDRAREALARVKRANDVDSLETELALLETEIKCLEEVDGGDLMEWLRELRDVRIAARRCLGEEP